MMLLPEKMSSSRKKHQFSDTVKKFAAPSTDFAISTVLTDVSCIGLKKYEGIDKNA